MKSENSTKSVFPVIKRAELGKMCAFFLTEKDEEGRHAMGELKAERLSRAKWARKLAEMFERDMMICDKKWRSDDFHKKECSGCLILNELLCVAEEDEK